MKKKVHIIGTSTTTNHGIGERSWPELLKAKLSDKAEVTVDVQMGLTFTRAIPMLSDLEPVDILIFQFGTAVGWPISLQKVDVRLGTTPRANEYAYHQPMGAGSTKFRRFKNRAKYRTRNLVKYLLFFAGQYKPRSNPRDLEDQIKAVLSIAHTKAKEVIWIQHVPAWSMRTCVERWYHRKYLERIRYFADKYSLPNTHFIIPDGALVDIKNYAPDTTHLSAEGHKAYAKYLEEALNAFL